ncbi:MAG: dephospho-CoA kinase [Fusobacterium sp.]|nr:dephospho-CoA kinase [Fusobacterium sp.]
MIIGLTGGIASGKSTVSKYLAEKKFKIYDADKIAKEIFETEEVQKEIILNFGEEILEGNNKKNIDRNKLKEIVFKNSEKLKILNSIIHPKVYKFFENIKKGGSTFTSPIVFDVPLLFESGIDKLCDKIILVVVDYGVQIQRIKKRDNVSEELAKKIISSQLSNEEKMKKSDYIIENNGSLEELLEKVENLIKK